LETFLEKYNQLLLQRSGLIEETEAIRRQNAELKLLLNQYLGSKVCLVYFLLTGGRSTTSCMSLPRQPSRG
jgi:hypothetical protein